MRNLISKGVRIFIISYALSCPLKSMNRFCRELNLKMIAAKPHSPNKSLNISIVSYDSTVSLLLNTLKSVTQAVQKLRELDPDFLVTLIIVDNYELNRLTLDLFSSLRKDLLEANCELLLIQGHGNIGYGSGQNLAVYSRPSHYHLFMNPDVEIAPNSLIAGVTYLESNRDVAIVSPNATNAEGKKQFLCKRYPTLLDLALRGFSPRWIQGMFTERLSHYEMRELNESSATKGIPIVSGCFMLCRGEAIRKVSGFDVAFFLYFEDFDLSLRVSEWATIAYLPSMRIQHTGGHAARKGFNHIGYFIRSALRFFKIYKWRWF